MKPVEDGLALLKLGIAANRIDTSKRSLARCRRLKDIPDPLSEGTGGRKSYLGLQAHYAFEL